MKQKKKKKIVFILKVHMKLGFRPENVNSFFFFPFSFLISKRKFIARDYFMYNWHKEV